MPREPRDDADRHRVEREERRAAVVAPGTRRWRCAGTTAASCRSVPVTALCHPARQVGDRPARSRRGAGRRAGAVRIAPPTDSEATRAAIRTPRKHQTQYLTPSRRRMRGAASARRLAPRSRGRRPRPRSRARTQPCSVARVPSASGRRGVADPARRRTRSAPACARARPWPRTTHCRGPPSRARGGCRRTTEPRDEHGDVGDLEGDEPPQLGQREREPGQQPQPVLRRVDLVRQQEAARAAGSRASTAGSRGRGAPSAATRRRRAPRRTARATSTLTVPVDRHARAAWRQAMYQRLSKSAGRCALNRKNSHHALAARRSRTAGSRRPTRRRSHHPQRDRPRPGVASLEPLCDERAPASSAG